MVTRKLPILEWNEENKNKVILSIIKNLSPDLLPKKFRQKNETNPMFGHCHTTSGCFYKIFSSYHVHLYRTLDNNQIYHWWVQDNNGNIIDITESQYSKSEVVRYHQRGEKSNLLGFEYKKRVEILFNRVITDLGIQV